MSGRGKRSRLGDSRDLVWWTWKEFVCPMVASLLTSVSHLYLVVADLVVLVFGNSREWGQRGMET